MSRITEASQLVLDSQYKLEGGVFDPTILAGNNGLFIYKGPDEEDKTLHVFTGVSNGQAQYLLASLFNTDVEFASVSTDE